MKTIMIAGGSGFLGQSLGKFAADNGYKVLILSRSRPNNEFSGWIQWDARTIGPWINSLGLADALVNFVGRTVDCIKTPENVDQIWRSRIESTQVLGEALDKLDHRPSVWIQMSTAHIYGDSPDVWCDENSVTGYGLAPDVGRAWEDAYNSSRPRDIRSIVLRTGFVIGRGGGAYSRMKQVVRMGLGGKIGSGMQGMSWIHELDLNRMIIQMAERTDMSGIYVASSPNPMDKKSFMREFRKSLGIPIGLPAPEWLVRFGARYVFNTDPELALYGRFVRSSRLEKEGFTFQFPVLKAALRDLRG